jgi:hypothetical protein
VDHWCASWRSSITYCHRSGIWSEATGYVSRHAWSGSSQVKPTESPRMSLENEKRSYHAMIQKDRLQQFPSRLLPCTTAARSGPSRAAQCLRRCTQHPRWVGTRLEQLPAIRSSEMPHVKQPGRRWQLPSKNEPIRPISVSEVSDTAPCHHTHQGPPFYFTQSNEKAPGILHGAFSQLHLMRRDMSPTTRIRPFRRDADRHLR